MATASSTASPAASATTEQATVPAAVDTASTTVSPAVPLAMPPPPEGSFNSRDQLVASVQQHALSHSYATNTERSNLDQNICIRCDRGGIYRGRIDAPKGSRHRRTSTKRIGYRFRLSGSKRKTDSKWYLQIREPSHNHPPDDDMIAHPIARQLT